MAVRLVVGLGNPGPQYAATRHNAGAWCVAAWAAREGATFKNQSAFSAQCAQLPPVLWALPTTFMNNSGLAVAALIRFYRIPVEALLVVHDELDVPAGQVRLKTGGGHGGHNGLRDIIQRLGTPDFHRLRIGIGHPGRADQVHGYVLSPPSPEAAISIDRAIEAVCDTRALLIAAEWSQAMNHLHAVAY